MNKTIVITGASRGIGFETAARLANQHHKVIAIARSEENLHKLANSVSSPNITPVVADITTPTGIENIVASTKDLAIDGIINNAGATHRQEFMLTKISDWQRLMDVNLFGIVRLIQALKPQLKPGSHILNISSMSGFQGSAKFAGLSAYGATKAAVIGLTEVLSEEFSGEKIAVNCLCLGAVKTEMLAEAFPGYEAPVSAQQMGEYIGDFVLKAHHYYNGKVLPVALNNPD